MNKSRPEDVYIERAWRERCAALESYTTLDRHFTEMTKMAQTIKELDLSHAEQYAKLARQHADLTRQHVELQQQAEKTEAGHNVCQQKDAGKIAELTHRVSDQAISIVCLTQALAEAQRSPVVLVRRKSVALKDGTKIRVKSHGSRTWLVVKPPTRKPKA